MKKLFSFICFLFFAGCVAGQTTDSLLNSLETGQEAPPLLPEKVIITQRMLWGSKGLLRLANIAPLTPDGRAKELKLRRTLLGAHQVLGLLTLGGYVGQGIVGGMLYKNYTDDLRRTHRRIATGVNISYGLAAAAVLFAPPPLLNRDKGLTTTRVHKWLSVVHLTGMIATNVLASKINRQPHLKPYHRAAAYTTFATYAVSVLVLKF